MKWTKFLCIGLLAGLSGCANQYPMGLSKEQWQGLSPTQQAEYQARQYAIDEERRQQAEAQRVRQEMLAAEQARIERERVQALYANARFGDIVHVTVQGGCIEYNRQLYPYEPVAFDLVRGEAKQILFRGQQSHNMILETKFNVRLSEDGNTIYFDDTWKRRVVLVNNNWERGQRYGPGLSTRNDIGIGMSGMIFTVKYKDFLPGAPQRLVIENR